MRTRLRMKQRLTLGAAAEGACRRDSCQGRDGQVLGLIRSGKHAPRRRKHEEHSAPQANGQSSCHAQAAAKREASQRVVRLAARAHFPVAAARTFAYARRRWSVAAGGRDAAVGSVRRSGNRASSASCCRACMADCTFWRKKAIRVRGKLGGIVIG